MSIQVLALVLPSCVNMGEGWTLLYSSRLFLEVSGSTEGAPNQMDSGPFRTHSQVVGSMTLPPSEELQALDRRSCPGA